MVKTRGKQYASPNLPSPPQKRPRKKNEPQQVPRQVVDLVASLNETLAQHNLPLNVAATPSRDSEHVQHSWVEGQEDSVPVTESDSDFEELVQKMGCQVYQLLAPF